MGGVPDRAFAANVASGRDANWRLQSLHSNAREQAAVHQIISACAERGAIGHEKRCELSNFFGGANSTQRMRGAKSLNDRINGQIRRKMRGGMFEHRRANGTRADGIDTNVISGVVQCESARQTVQAALRRGVGGNPTLAGVALNRGEDDDRSAASFAHFRNAEMREEISAAEIYGHATVPGFRICFDGVPEGMKGRAVGNEIQPAEFCDGFRDRGLDLRRNAHVAQLDANGSVIRVGYLLEFAVCGLRRCRRQ